MSDKITDLETRLTWQEDTINCLNTTIAKQQREIDILQQQVLHLKSLMDELADNQASDSGHHAPPPHY